MGELFDKFGRCIPGDVNSAVQKKVRRYFRCEQPDLDLDIIYDRICKAIGGADQITCDQFKARVEDLLNKLKEDEKVCNICTGVYMPFFLPKQDISDMGEALDETYIPGIASSFADKFPDYSFVNHHTDPLKGTLTVDPTSRHQAVIDKTKNDVVVGLYFPAMDGYSIAAAREQIQYLPDAFSLAGGIDTCAALIAAPDLLLRLEGYPPLLWFGALEADEPTMNYHIEAYGYDLNFNRRAHLGNADEYWANGIVFTD